MFCRAGGIRTRDLLVPNQARYHLRYCPYWPSVKKAVYVIRIPVFMPLDGSCCGQNYSLKKKPVRNLTGFSGSDGA